MEFLIYFTLLFTSNFSHLEKSENNLILDYIAHNDSIIESKYTALFKENEIYIIDELNPSYFRLIFRNDSVIRIDSYRNSNSISKSASTLDDFKKFNGIFTLFYKYNPFDKIVYDSNLHKKKIEPKKGKKYKQAMLNYGDSMVLFGKIKNAYGVGQRKFIYHFKNTDLFFSRFPNELINLNPDEVPYFYELKENSNLKEFKLFDTLNIKVTDLNNNKHDLKDFSDKILIIDFWYIGCKPCHLLSEKLVKLKDKEKLKDKFKIIRINFSDKDVEKIKIFTSKFYTEGSIDLYKGREDFKNYAFSSFPQILILDKNLVIRLNHKGNTNNVLTIIEDKILEIGD